MSAAKAIRLEDRPKTRPSCHIREVGTEKVVYEPRSHEVVVLNGTAALMFELSDGTRTVVEMLAVLQARYAADVEVLRRDLFETLARFQGAGLLED